MEISITLQNKERYLVAANSEKNRLIWHPKSSAEKGFYICLVSVLPKAGNLAGACHFNAKHKIRTSQP